MFSKAFLLSFGLIGFIQSYRKIVYWSANH